MNLTLFVEKGSLGTWASTYGRYFSRREDLARILISRLENDWYTQNYVGKYFMFSLPGIATDKKQREELAENLAYAALSNKAKIVRERLLEAAPNYPSALKKLLKASVQERKQNDPDYADSLLEALND